MEILPIVVVGTIFLILGLGIMHVYNKMQFSKRLTDANFKSRKLVDKAKKDANEIKYKAKKEARKEAEEEREEIDGLIQGKKQEIKKFDKEMSKKEASLERESEENEQELRKIQSRRDELKNQEKRIVDDAEKYKKRQRELSEELARVSGLTREEAKNILLKEMEEDARVDFAKVVRRLEEESKEEPKKRSIYYNKYE